MERICKKLRPYANMTNSNATPHEAIRPTKIQLPNYLMIKTAKKLECIN